jgi:RNA-directed DNA polymerase
MRLCLFRDGLPQGAPTSPCLSNLANFWLDERLEQLAQKTRAVYTRYGDDLNFSWGTTQLPGGFTNAVEDALASAGYEIQPRKGWRIQSIHDRPVVTGIVLAGDGRLTVPTAVRIKMLWLRWQSLWSSNEHTTARLRGFQAYVDMVNRKRRTRKHGRRRAW